MTMPSVRGRIIGNVSNQVFAKSKRRTFLCALLVSSSSSFCPIEINPSAPSCGISPVISQHVCSRRWSPKTRAFLSSTTDTLAQNIRLSYEENETDGIIDLATSMEEGNIDINGLIDATIQATDGNNGKTASILNAFIGGFSLFPDSEVASTKVAELLEAYEMLEDDGGARPDIVSYSLAFHCFLRDEDSSELADYVLDKASRMSKKMAGNKRRKLLAASRRKSSSTCTDAEDALKDVCGSGFQVLYETDDLFVINKPSGIPCFHKKLTTAGKIGKRKGKGSTGANAAAAAVDISLEDALLNCNVPLSTLNPDALGLVHRLDRVSSGCLVLAKSDEMHAQLIAEFFLRRTEKKYLALLQTSGDTQLPEHGQINSLVDGRPARSEFQVLENYNGKAALVEFEIETGRKHQIRVQALEELSSPVVLDRMYETSPEQNDLIESLLPGVNTKQQICLHASSLRIPGLGIEVEAPRPSWWDPALEYFQK